jgi:hypothetical protein
MNIERAKLVQVGQSVRCPSDRGDAAFIGKVTHISPTVCENFAGEPYIWIQVRNGTQSGGVWPSNRLSPL